jgi:hypothetical protein
MGIEKNRLNVPHPTAVRTTETLQRPDARRQSLAGREVQLRAEQRAYVAREYPGVSVGEFDKLQGVFKNRSPDEIAKMLANLNVMGMAITQKILIEKHRSDEGYVGGVDTRLLETLNTLFPEKSINSLCVCLLNAPDLDPQKLFNLCKIFPTKDPEDLTHIMNDVTDKAVLDAIQQNATFSDAKINPEHVAGALKRIPQLSIQKLSALCKDNAEMSSSDVVDRAQLRFLFPGTEPQMISGALEKFYNRTGSTFDEFVVLTSNGLIPKGEGPDSFSFAIAESQRYRNRLKALAPAAEPGLVSEALYNISKVEKSSFVEFEKLIDDGIVGRGDLRSAVDQYGQYKANWIHLEGFFPGAEPPMIARALKDVNGINNSSLDEFVTMIRNGTLSRGKGERDLPVAVTQYRQHKNSTQLQEYFPGASSEMISDALQDVTRIPNASFDDLVKLIRNGTVSKGKGERDLPVAVAQYREYKKNWTQLRNMFPGSSTGRISRALQNLSRIPNSSFAEFVRLITNNTVSRGRGEGNTTFAVYRYEEYKENLPHLEGFFPGAKPPMIARALKDLNGIDNSSLGEFVAMIRAGTLPRGEGEGDLPVAVAQYRQFKWNLYDSEGFIPLN